MYIGFCALSEVLATPRYTFGMGVLVEAFLVRSCSTLLGEVTRRIAPFLSAFLRKEKPP